MNGTSYSKNEAKRSKDIAQKVENLPSKCKSVSSNAITSKTKIQQQQKHLKLK
jgi:hypothetical protein